MSEELENMARALCNDQTARVVASAIHEPPYDESRDEVKAYWLAIARAAIARAKGGE